MLRFLFTFLVVFSLNGVAQTVAPNTPKVNINSGNPKFPFPQFLEYNQGKTLAKYNAEGVTHADMEKAIREAYQVMANRFRYTGDVVDGVKYIRSNLGCPYDCAEGEGYGLLAAAYMADKITFDGIWMRIHDDMVVRTPKYKNGTVSFPTYRYGKHTIKEESGDAAADGDYDIGLALLMATKQWGNSGVTVANGSGGTKQMSYLEEAFNIISDLSDTTVIHPLGTPAAIDGWVSGHIGMDGYPKGGNTFSEVTSWANVSTNVPRPSCEVFTGCGPYPGFASYIAPSYYRSFAQFLTDNGGSTWNINQFKRAEASTEWLMGQSFAQNRLPFGGGYSVVGTNATFSEADPKQGKVDGESFRMAWRTILNYMWRGNGIYTWNPSTHQFALGTNTAMKDNALKLGAFLKDNGICASLGSSPDPVSTTVKHKGIAQMRQYHLSDGTSPSGNWTNYTLGTSSPSAVASGDETLIAELYRQLELKWDDENTALGENDTIIVNSTPKYFHGWFRLLGMMTLTGNLHAPENMVSKANMKVYVAVNKTFAFVGDDITYTVDYRNYGAENASNTQIVIPVSSQYEIIDGGGGSISGSTITFNIGTVPGFASTTGITPTKGSKTIKLKVKSPKSVDRVCLIATISCGNGTGWISNEYPNNATYSMQRNCVDILGERALKIVKTSNKTEVNPQSTVDFTLNFENSTSGGWLNGGRKNVNFSYAYAGSGPNSYFHLFRNWNNAQEAYINLSNYRASFFMFDNVNKGIYNATTNPSGWTLIGKNLQTGQLADFDFKGEKIPVGSDANGKWDQRIIIRFPSDITAPTHAVLSHLGNRFQLHKGTLKPIWYSVQMESNPPSPLFTGRIQDDWSYISTSFSASVGSGSEPYFLIGPNYADYNSATGVIMDRFDKDACSAFFTPDKIYNTILVEEFDGYAWRRVAGEGPLPGREIYNVTVLDTIPSDFQFVKFIDDDADGTKATLFTSGGFEIIKWSVPKVLVGMKGDLKYQVKVKGACPGTPDKVVSNKAWFSSDTDSPIAGIADVKVTCAFVPPPISGTTMFKKADKTSYLPNDNINYSIKLIQTLGTISIPPTTDATRWTAIDGTASDMPKFTPTGIDFDNNKPGIFIRENYSHGKNGTLIAEVDNDGQEMFGFVFRYTSGNRTSGPIMGLYLEVQLAYFSNQANIKLYQNGTVIGSLIGEAYAAPYDKAVMKVELTDGVMKLWINDISGLPITTFSGITNQSAGFVGFAVGDKNRSSSIYSKPKILNWNSHFDSAFDVQVSDPLPAGTTFVSATGSGFETAGRVTWPKILGPMLYGDSVKYTLITKVGTSCPSNGKIINMSYVNLFGIKTDSIGAQSVATCGGPQTCTPPSSVLATNSLPTACAGQSVTLKATVSPSAGSFKYQWYKKTSGVDPTKFVSTYTDYLFTNSAVADTGIYVIRVTDANDLTCFKESQTTVVVNPIPNVFAGNDTLVCEGSNFRLNGSSTNSSATYTWTKKAGSFTSNSAKPTILNSNNSSSGIYYLKVTSNSCSKTDSVVITINTTPTVSILPLVKNCNASLDLNTLSTSPGTRKFYSDTTQPELTNTNVSISGTYYLQITNAQGCRSKLSLGKTVFQNNPEPVATVTPDTISYCGPNGVTLTASNAGAGATYQWLQNNIAFGNISTSNILNNALSGNYKVKVSLNNCSTTSIESTVKSKLSSSAAIKISAPATACENTLVTVNVLSKSIGTIEWFENGLSKGTASNYSFTAVNNVIIKAVLKSSESCASPKFAKDTISITVDKSPSKATITTTPKPLIETCLSSLQLNATTIGNGVWSKSGAAATISSTGLLSQIPDAVVIKVFYTVSNGVCIPSKDSISVQKFASVSISNVKTQSQVLCKDASYTNPKLIGSTIKTDESGTWEADPQTLALIDANTGQTSNLKYGTNKFYFRVKNQSCNTLYSLDSVTIKLDSLPAKPYAGPDQDICTTNFELNTTNSINKIKWTSDKTGVAFVNDTLYKTFANNLPINTPTLFMISAVNGACKVPAKDTVSITSKGAITTANVRSQSKSICETDGLPVLAANSLKSDESGTWKSLTTGANINNSGTITSLVVGNNEFLYTISSSVCTAKTSIDTVLIIKDQLPSKPNAGPDQNICTTNFDLNVGISKGKIKWSSNQPRVSIANDTLYKTAANNLPVNITTIFTVSAVNGACKTPVSDIVAVTAKGSLTKANVKSQSSAVCSDIALPTLNGNNKQPGETSKWASLTSGAFIDSTGKIKNLVSGINKFEYSISGSTCPGKSKDTVIFAVKTKLVALISSPTSNNGTYKTQLTSVSIQALSDPNIGYTGKWEKSGQGVLNNTSATLNDLSGLNSDGITKVYWIVSENTRTCQPDTAVIYIEKVTGDYASAGIDTTVCESSLPVLKGTGSKSGIWKALTTQTVINQNGNNANVVSASSVTVNQYSYCVTSTICDTVNITVKKADIPSVSIFPSPSDKNCEGDSVWLRIDQISPLKPDIFTYIWKKNYAVINNETSTQYKTVNWKDNDVISLHIKAIPGKACFNPDTAFAQITLKLIPVFTPSVTIYSNTTKLNCEADPISFKIKNKQGQGLKPIYNWLYNNQEFGNDSVLVLTSWKNSDNVELKMRSSQQCAKPDTSLSNIIILNGTPRINSKINLAIKGLPEGSIQCKDAPVNLEAKSSVKNVTYNWTDGTNISTDSTFSKILSSITVINLTATSKPGCYLSGDSLKETQTVTISIAEPVEINLIYDETENCKNAPQTLRVSSKGNIKAYKWFINDQLQTGKNLNSEIFTYLNFHDIVTVEAVPLLNCNNGIYTDTARVNVYDKPINGFANGDNLAFKCYLEPITLLAKESNVNYTYNWSRNGISQPSLNNSLLVLEEGKYQLQISNNSCLTKSEIEVKDNQVRVKIVTDHTEFLPGETLDAEAIVNSGNTNGITYSWSPNNIVTIGNAFKTQVIPIETVLLKVNVTTTEGCKGKDSLLLKKKDKLFIPNAITPGGNEINAYWGIKGTENYPDLDIKVFNRWGTLVHEQKGYSTPWDGTINGKALPTGTYYYVIKDPKSKDPFVGDLTIVR